MHIHVQNDQYLFLVFDFDSFAFLFWLYSQFSGDDTDDHSIQSKHKDKSHSRADDSREKSSSRKRVHENQDCNGIDDRKHSKSERHHRRSK